MTRKGTVVANEPISKSASEIMRTLHELSLETEDEILAMSREQVRSRLFEEGIDLDASDAEFASRLKTIREEGR